MSPNNIQGIICSTQIGSKTPFGRRPLIVIHHVGLKVFWRWKINHLLIYLERRANPRPHCSWQNPFNTKAKKVIHRKQTLRKENIYFIRSWKTRKTKGITNHMLRDPETASSFFWYHARKLWELKWKPKCCSIIYLTLNSMAESFLLRFPLSLITNMNFNFSLKSIALYCPSFVGGGKLLSFSLRNDPDPLLSFIM